MFQGFSQQTVDFLWNLRLNNERTWFQAHKEEFINHVDTPLRALAAQLGDYMTEQYPELGLQLKVTRIHRDARRLFGRGPYKDVLWFALERPHLPGACVPCFYFDVAPDYYGYGMGWFDPAPVTMAKWRARIDRDPKPLKKLARKVAGQTEFSLQGQEYKRPKAETDPLLMPWYNRRQLSLSSEHNCQGIFFTPQLADQLRAGFDFLVPFYRYLWALEGDAPPDHQ